MKRSCPTIQELLVLDAVATQGSLTRAAASLCMSVSAVSKQLSGLERFVNRQLLRKVGRGVQLTAAGREYWTKIAPCLQTIQTASFEVRAAGSGNGVLTLASVPTFLTKWLIPRLADFRQAHPGITFSFSQHLEVSDRHPLQIDAAIRYGTATWPGVSSDYITGREFICIRAAGQVDLTRPLQPLDALLSQTLLHHDQAPGAWQKWATAHGIDSMLTMGGPRFAQYSAVIQAALSGLGIGLVPKVLVQEELDNGRAVAVGKVVELDMGHYLCFLPERLERPVFAAFRSWVLAQGAQRPSGLRPDI